MKIKSLKNSLLATALLTPLIGGMDTVSAHGEPDALLASFGAGATDVYEITCAAGTSFLEITIRDALAKGGKISAMAFKTGQFNVVTTTDIIGGDGAAGGAFIGSGYSPEVRVTGGVGKYTVIVHHTAATTEGYHLVYHCEDINGFETLFSSIVQKQNQ